MLLVALVVMLTGVAQATPRSLAPPVTKWVVATPATSAPALPLMLRPRLLVLGDSVPAGTVCGCPGFGADLAARMPAVLNNAAQPGLTSAGLLAQVESPTMARVLDAADIVTITIGANDFDHSHAADDSCASLGCYQPALQQLTSNMNAVLGRVLAQTRPGTKVVLTGYWNVFLDGSVGAQLGATYVANSDALTRQVNTVLAQVARNGNGLYADLYTPFKEDGSADDTDLLASDGDHPNAAGHEMIATAIAAAAHLVIQPH
ncbi:MAG: SGNH/GDSL hydrolase family protein [Mycobacteriales bacterium]